MKKLIYCLCCLSAILSFTACSDDDDLNKKIDFSLPYQTIAVADDPNDSIQHYVYEIYQKYGVPVLFNDTVTRKYIGKDFFGNDLYRYETIDLDWSFTGHGKSNFKFNYVKTPEEKMAALRYAEAYLKIASRPMRPFCIFMVNDMEYNNNDKKPYYVNYRTLVLSQFAKYADKSDSLATAIVRTMVKDRVKADKNLVDKFGSVSSTNNWYGRLWKDGTTSYGEKALGCTNKWIGYNTAGWIAFSPSNMFGRSGQSNYEDAIHAFSVHFLGRSEDNLLTPEEYDAYCLEFMDEIGQFGFISGGGASPAYFSPDNVEDDLNAYLNEMLSNGDAVFRQRYKQPLVLQKYQILYDFITGTLEVKL